jgi:phage tail-like protein
MRALAPGLESPHQLGGHLPALLQEDWFAQRFVSGLDEVLSPVFASLDGLECYIDSRLAPEDFLRWLAGWVSVELDERWPLERQRAFVAAAIDLYARRGTVGGLLAHIELVTGGTAVIAESGGVASSQSSGGDLPGETAPRMSIRVAVDDPSAVDPRALDTLVSESKPAHVVHQVEVVKR